MHIVTADGGFDFSIDFNKQEINVSKLLFAQLCYAIVLQKKGGTFILKIFDCFMEQSIHILYILSSFYEKIYLMKPNTSRYANSEKYVICKGFLYNSSDHYYSYLYNAFNKMLHVNSNQYIHRFLNVPISSYFITKLEEFNAIFGQQQIENIHYTITLIDSKNNQDKVDSLVRNNIQKAIQWCSKHNVPYNLMIESQNDNVFTKS
jgi:cap1 methyltransferase